MVNESMISYVLDVIARVFSWLSTHYIVSYKAFHLSFLAASLSLIVARVVISIFFGGVENDDDGN